MALITYESQTLFGMKWIKSGHIKRLGTWRNGSTWGEMWGGTVCGFYVQMETIGIGPYMRAGSFKVRALDRPT
jgi:hypothetical protein